MRPTDNDTRTSYFSALTAQRTHKTAGSIHPTAAGRERQESWRVQAMPRSPQRGRKSKRDLLTANQEARMTALFVSIAARTDAPGKKLPQRKAVRITD